jgi:shikimate kinase
VTERQNIILVGFMGTGKSSVGRRLARKLGFEFVDTDRVLAEHAGMEIAEIFAQHGEAHFRELETGALESLGQLTRSVIATGGGIILRERNRELLRELGFVVALTASEEVIFERVSRNANRPLLQNENPRETVSRMLSERRAHYEAAAQFCIDTSLLGHDEVAAAIAAKAREAFSWQAAP